MGKKSTMKPLLALRASAGSGKTFRLSLRYIALLFSGVPPGRILTLTFTRKAAREMEERIVKFLRLLAEGKADASLLETLEKEGVDRKLIDQQAGEILKRFWRDDSKIMTIDSFLSWMLRKFCWYAGVRPTFRIASERPHLLYRAFLDSLSQGELEQLYAFSSFWEQGIERTLQLFAELSGMEQELPLPPVSDVDLQVACDQLEDEILQHALKIKDYVLTERENLHKSASQSVDYEDFDGFLKKFKTVLEKEQLNDFSYFKKITSSVILDSFQEIKTQLRDYYRLRERLLFESFHLFLDRYEEAAKRYKKSRNELSYQDVTRHCYELQRTIDGEFLYFRLDDRIEHILIDEFQDTSFLQYKILEPLIEEIKSGLGAGGIRSFFFVGDTKQSIYRFRGSNSRLFDQAALGMAVEDMKVNYRSSQSVVKCANQLFHDMPGYTPQKAHSKELGFVQIQNSEELIEDVVLKLQHLLLLGYPEDEIAILTFKNDDILELESHIKKKLPDVSTVTDTSSRLVHQHAPKALINLLKYLDSHEQLYASNFLTLIGRNPKDSLLLPPLHPLDAPAPYVRNIMKEFSLNDEHAVRFLEIAASYPTFYALMEDIDYLDEQVEAAASHGVKLMTIHKSKGLEFQNVIVVDILGRRRGGGSRMIQDYEGTLIKGVHFRFKGREHLDDEYAKVLEREKGLEKEDTLNTLYVAFTRAQHNLVALQKSNGLMGLLEQEELTMGALSFCTQSVPEAKPLPELPRIEWKSFGRQLDYFPKEKDKTPFDPAAVLQGNAAHLFFEALHHLDADGADVVWQHIVNRYGYQLKNLQTLKEKLIATLDDPRFARIASCRCYKEVQFLYHGESGRIDLLAECEDGIIIVDFKTSSQASQVYREQLRYYGEVIQDLLGFSVKLYLVLVDHHPQIIEVV